jgi:hypothetical protein|tara:strand:+ start:120 stop:569 length:450 start_codon:yes stop_codon:yes gene_type:complete
MSQFECNIKDLIKVDEEIIEERVEYEEPKVTDDQRKPVIEELAPNKISRRVKTDPPNRQVTDTSQKDVEKNITKIIINEIKDRKNHRVFLIIIGLSLLLNSAPVYKLISDIFPYLMESVSQLNIKGKILIAFLISCAIIISRSSLLNRP